MPWHDPTFLSTFHSIFALYCICSIIASIMKKSLTLIFLIPFVLSGCNKSDETPSNSGNVTINNTTYQSTTYYVYGFLFSKAKTVSTLENPGPDITVYVNSDTPANTWLYLQANNLNPSFSKIGDYPDAESASAAFDNLKTVGNYQWTDLAQPIAPNQVWVYKTGTPCYAKLRIISTVNETRDNLPYGECTFEWVYQPDGSTTFPK
jgi:hypothetical protein